MLFAATLQQGVLVLKPKSTCCSDVLVSSKYGRHYHRCGDVLWVDDQDGATLCWVYVWKLVVSLRTKSNVSRLVGRCCAVLCCTTCGAHAIDGCSTVVRYQVVLLQFASCCQRLQVICGHGARLANRSVQDQCIEVVLYQDVDKSTILWVLHCTSKSIAAATSDHFTMLASVSKACDDCHVSGSHFTC